MNIENVHRIIEDFENAPIVMNRVNYCDECNTEMYINNDQYVCNQCGLCGDYIPALEAFEQSSHMKKVLYRRRIYCVDKLRMISCLKSPRTQEYINTIKKLSTEDFSNIYELYDIMKEMNMFKYYKNIYDIFHSIKKVKLIELTYNQIERITDDFIEIERKFKSVENNTRQNMFNYSSIIKVLLQKHKIRGAEHLILPYNHEEMIKHIKALC